MLQVDVEERSGSWGQTGQKGHQREAFHSHVPGKTGLHHQQRGTAQFTIRTFYSSFPSQRRYRRVQRL